MWDKVKRGSSMIWEGIKAAGKFIAEGAEYIWDGVRKSAEVAFGGVMPMALPEHTGHRTSTNEIGVSPGRKRKRKKGEKWEIRHDFLTGGDYIFAEEKEINSEGYHINPEGVEIGEGIMVAYNGDVGELIYRVREGDTLSEIAKANGMRLDELLELNPQIKDANKIKVGEEIRLREESFFEKVGKKVKEMKRKVVNFIDHTINEVDLYFKEMAIERVAKKKVYRLRY